MKDRTLILAGIALVGGAILIPKFLGQTAKETSEGAVGGVISGFTGGVGSAVNDLLKIPEGYLDYVSGLEKNIYSQTNALGQSFADAQQQIAQTAQAVAVSATLPKSSGSYSSGLFTDVPAYTYTSPQGYQMSVAPVNVSKVANKYASPTPTTQTTTGNVSSIQYSPATGFSGKFGSFLGK